MNRRHHDPNKNISWSRRVKADGHIVYKFYRYGFHWMVTVTHLNMSRKQIALHLRAARKNFKRFINYKMREVVRVGGVI